MTIGDWARGVALDGPTYLWLRRRQPSIVGKRLNRGAWRIVGTLADYDASPIEAAYKRKRHGVKRGNDKSVV